VITDGWLAIETNFTIYNEEEKELTASTIRKAGAEMSSHFRKSKASYL
jgi:hypothetical protein